MKGPFIGLWGPVVILALLLLLVSPQKWRQIATPPWQRPNPVRSTLSAFLLLVALGFLIAAHRFMGLERAEHTAFLAATFTAMFLADLISPHPSRRTVLLVFQGLLVVAWLALLAKASHLPR